MTGCVRLAYTSIRSWARMDDGAGEDLAGAGQLLLHSPGAVHGIADVGEHQGLGSGVAHNPGGPYSARGEVFQRVTTPTPLQQRAFELLGVALT